MNASVNTLDMFILNLSTRNDVEHLFDFSQNKELTKSDLKVSPVNVYTLIQKYFFIEKQDKNRVVSDKYKQLWQLFNSIFLI